MKIYILIYESHDDVIIYGAFSTKALAEERKSKLRLNREDVKYVHIIETTLDETEK